MENNWTKEAENVLSLALESAVSLQHRYVGTEHLLLGLLAEKDGTAARALTEAGVKPTRLVELISELVTPAADEAEEVKNPDTPEEAKSPDAPEEGKNPDTPDCHPKRTPRLIRILDEALRDASAREEEKAGTGHLLLALLRDTDSVAVRLLHTMNIGIPRLYSQVLGAMGFNPDLASRELGGSRGSGSVTPVLDRYSRDLTMLAMEGKLDPVIGREREIARLVQILSRRTKNNPCLAGEPGVGKTAIVEGLAQQIAQDRVPVLMKARRVVVLDLAGMVAGTKYRGEFEQRIRDLILEVRDHPGILLFIDELHTIIGAGSAEGTLDAANILKPALSRGEIQIIGATTLEEYRRYIEKDAALERRFQPVMVEEPSVDETVRILKGLRPGYEKHHGVVITDGALEAAAAMSARYITDRRLPDKAIDVIDEAASKVRLKGWQSQQPDPDPVRHGSELVPLLENALKEKSFAEAARIRREMSEAGAARTGRSRHNRQQTARKPLLVEEQDAASVISDWTRIPVSSLTEGESKRLARLEQELHKRVIGQDEAVTAVARAVRRGRVGLKDEKRPIGSFLFLGPTGVGKTELSKALAEAVFGSEQNMIRLDMSEYMEKHSVSKIIGSPPGYVGFEEGGQLSEKVRRNPYSVLLFDEIEEAHPDVFNILLQILDEGRITDSHGRRVDFRQTIIILTSNAGAQAIVEPKRLGFVSGEDKGRDYERMKSQVMEEVRRIFRPEFLNRIDEIMVFHMLSGEEVRRIVDLFLSELAKRCREQMEISLHVSAGVRDEIAKAGFDPKYGARPLRRQIQTKIEDALAGELLEGHFHKGDEVRVRMKNGAIVFTQP